MIHFVCYFCSVIEIATFIMLIAKEGIKKIIKKLRNMKKHGNIAVIY